MPYMPTNHSDVPIRLFKSDFLEFFTHIHPAVVPVIWLPVAAYFLSRPIVNQALSASSIVLALVLGAIVWSFTEYTMHRFVFHFEPKNPHPWWSAPSSCSTVCTMFSRSARPASSCRPS